MITPEMLAKSGTEHGCQMAIFCWSNLAEVKKQYPVLQYMFAIPNGGWRGMIQGAALKAEGVKPGVPDILLPVKRGLWSGLFIELKRPSSGNRPQGKVSSEQQDFIYFLTIQGYKCRVCVGWIQARDQIVNYMES